MNLRSLSTVSDRRKAISEHVGVHLPHIGTFSLDEAAASSRNCENMLGVAQIPMGVAGPLRIRGTASENVTQEYYIPLATTEGALIASVNRGCKVITESGGAVSVVERVGITRGPVFKTASLLESFSLRDWIETHEDQIREYSEKTSSHIHFLSSHVQILGNYVYVRFVFDSQDAMGMNMATIATQAIAELIEKETSHRCLAISGNFCVDKKPSWQNMILGRGFRAWAEVSIPTTILTSVLKVTADALFEAWEAKCLLGSILSGSMGFNGHAANIIAALYIATGQDPAHVVEGSSAVTTMEKRDGGIFIRVFLPSVVVGTVGGGTTLATQKEALSILGISGGDKGHNAERLAGIVASAVLAGEVSELAAITNGSLAKAHQELGRGK